MDSDDLGTPLADRTAVYDREQLLARRNGVWSREIEREKLPVSARHALYKWLDSYLPGWDEPPVVTGGSFSPDELMEKLITVGRNNPGLLSEIQRFHAGFYSDVEQMIRSTVRREPHAASLRRVICLVLFVRRHTPLPPR